MSKIISRTISKGQRDIELLGALIGNDSSRFNRVIARLEREVRQIASELLDGENIEEAVFKARNKIIDWMRSDAPFKVSHPMAYATTLVRNAVIDYSRTTKERTIPEDQLKEDLAWIDGGMGYFGEDEKGNGQAGTGGWHGVKVSPGVLGQDILKLPAIHYPEHGWLRALGRWNLGKCVGWLLPDSWSAEDYLFNRFRGTGVRVKPGMVNGLLKSEQNRRWAQYKLVTALIDNIPSLREQQIMKHFLWGYRTTDIAKELDVSKAYVSKVVNTWLKFWGWDKVRRDRARIVLLIKFLADLYRRAEQHDREHLKIKHDIIREKVAVQMEKHRLRQVTAIPEGAELDKLLRKAYTNEDSLSLEEEERLTELYHKANRTLENKITIRMIFNPSYQRQLEDRERQRHRERLENIQHQEERQEKLWEKRGLFRKVISSPQTRAYFSDLRESDNLALLEVCSTCYDYWYG